MNEWINAKGLQQTWEWWAALEPFAKHEHLRLRRLCSTPPVATSVCANIHGGSKPKQHQQYTWWIKDDIINIHGGSKKTSFTQSAPKKKTLIQSASKKDITYTRWHKEQHQQHIRWLKKHQKHTRLPRKDITYTQWHKKTSATHMVDKKQYQRYHLYMVAQKRSTLKTDGGSKKISNIIYARWLKNRNIHGDSKRYHQHHLYKVAQKKPRQQLTQRLNRAQRHRVYMMAQKTSPTLLKLFIHQFGTASKQNIS